MRERLNLVDNEHILSTRKQCEILSVHRSGLYYKPQGEKEGNLEIMRIMDEHYLKHPTEGVMQQTAVRYNLSAAATKVRFLEKSV